MDYTVTEVPDEQPIRYGAEARRRHRDAPRRVQLAGRGEASHQVAVRIEEIDIAVPRSRDIVLLVCILFRVRHDEIAIHELDIERRKPGRHGCIDEAPDMMGAYAASKTSIVPAFGLAA